MQQPLGESLQKLRHAQRALVRRKRLSKVRVSFSHPSGSRTSLHNKVVTAKRTSRRVRPRVPPKGTDIVPVVVQETEIRKSIKQEKDKGPDPLLNQHDAEPSQENGRCCLGSPSKRRHKTPKADAKDDSTHPVKEAAVNRPYWGVLPQSPVRSPPKAPPKPERKPTKENVEPKYDQDALSEKKAQVSSSSPGGHRANKRRRPLAAVPSGTRYSFFPKQTYPSRYQEVDRWFGLADSMHSDSARRSLSQQRRLSPLIPPESQTAATQPRPAEQGHLGSSLSQIQDDGWVCPGEVECPSRTSSERRALNKFTRELEKFALATEASGKPPISTPTATTPPVSLNTVQELLPYREQFQQAGLAVTSADQRSPKKEEKLLPIRPRDSSSGDDRLRFDGVAGTSPVHSSSSKDSSSGTTIHVHKPGPVSAVVADEVSRKKQTQQPRSRVFPWFQKQEMQPLTISTEAQTSPTVDRGLLKPSHSATHLEHKPLPAKPRSPRRLTKAEEVQVPATPPQRTESGVVKQRPLPALPEKALPQVPTRGGLLDGACSSTASSDGQQTTSTGKDDERLSAPLPARTSSQSRHRVTLSSRSARITTSRQLPATIKEEIEPSPEKKKTPVHKSSQATNDSAQTQTKKSSGTHKPADAVEPGVNCTPELPKTWDNVITTPSSWEKAFDDVVSKLDDMEQKPAAGLAAKLAKPRPRSRSAITKIPSPSARLQRAAALRRQRVGGADGAARSEPTPVSRSSISTTATPPLPVSRQGTTSSCSSSQQRTAQCLNAARLSSTVAASFDDRDISDRDILKGLKIICAASADEELDAWIRSKTGLRLRRFLADLKTFEKLAEDCMVAIAEQREKRRQVAERRAQEQAAGQTRVRDSEVD
ncbi:hypothetical protein QBC46DRAFT_99821 [Diplogelasinospora grovesii]|uniref:Uncharacterized protein n=1 Tax=Diplogelasinospora grovesii TaxID=303347 RepID=A0AAN6N965_9PEZI|nr:hypothetical protein QBC46DRAFT_99821 [Diplogelasinospora grovesii]